MDSEQSRNQYQKFRKSQPIDRKGLYFKNSSPIYPQDNSNRDRSIQKKDPYTSNKQFDGYKENQKFGKTRVCNTNHEIPQNFTESESQHMEPHFSDEIPFEQIENQSDVDENTQDQDCIQVGWLDQSSSYHLENINPNSVTKTELTTNYTISENEQNAQKKCTICVAFFTSRNKLHNHIRLSHSKASNSKRQLKNSSTIPNKHLQLENNNNPLLVVKSYAPPYLSPPGYGFRGYHYAQLKIILHSPANLPNWVCLDSEYTMSLIEKTFLRQQCPAIKISCMPTTMTVRDIGSHTRPSLFNWICSFQTVRAMRDISKENFMLWITFPQKFL